jgi:hypothetical protein
MRHQSVSYSFIRSFIHGEQQGVWMITKSWSSHSIHPWTLWHLVSVVPELAEDWDDGDGDGDGSDGVSSDDGGNGSDDDDSLLELLVDTDDDNDDDCVDTGDDDEDVCVECDDEEGEELEVSTITLLLRWRVLSLLPLSLSLLGLLLLVVWMVVVASNDSLLSLLSSSTGPLRTFVALFTVCPPAAPAAAGTDCDNNVRDISWLVCWAVTHMVIHVVVWGSSNTAINNVIEIIQRCHCHCHCHCRWRLLVDVDVDDSNVGRVCVESVDDASCMCIRVTIAIANKIKAITR